jgi:EmrB/QacA subfamily drug resistance transporter
MASGVNIALAPIQSSFHGDLSELQWIVNASLLTLASLLPIGGSLGDRFGRKRVLLAGLLLFTAASIMSALARTIGQLIAFQAVQGAGAALVVPQNLAIINVSFAQNKRGQAIGQWAGLSGAVSALGPWASGWLVERFSWSAVFVLPGIVALAAFLVFSASVPESRNPEVRRLDWLGVILLLAGLFGLAYGLIAGPSDWTSPAVLAAVAGGLSVLVIFVLIESRRSDPAIPLRIFSKPLVSGANAATLLVYGALSGITLFSVLSLQQRLGYSPSAAGLAIIPTSVCITLLSARFGSAADRFGPRAQMVIGPLVVAAAAVWLAVNGTSGSYLLGFFPGFVLLGLGMAILIAPLTKSALSVPPGLSGAASGVNNTVSRIASLLAVAALGAIMLAAFSARLSESLQSSGLSADQQAQIFAQANKLGGIVLPPDFDAESRRSAQGVVSDSFGYAYRWAMMTCAMLALGGGLVSGLTVHGQTVQSDGSTAERP